MRWWVVALLVLGLFCAGCGGASAMEAPEATSAADYGGRGEPMSAAMPMEESADLAAADGMMKRQAAPGRPAPVPAPPPSAIEHALAQGEAGKADPPSDEGAAEPPATPETTTDVGTGPAQVAAPLLIYTAELRMGVFEAAESIEKVEQLTREVGGYLVRRDDRSITVRVPARKFQKTLAKITKLGDVLHRNVAARDVTEEYHDLSVRLRNAEVVLARLEQLLARANTVKDALAVEAELQRVAGEVERLKGKLKLLRELISFSTITVSFEGQPVEQIDTGIDLPFPWLGQLGLPNLLRF